MNPFVQVHLEHILNTVHVVLLEKQHLTINIQLSFCRILDSFSTSAYKTSIRHTGNNNIQSFVQASELQSENHSFRNIDTSFSKTLLLSNVIQVNKPLIF